MGPVDELYYTLTLAFSGADAVRGIALGLAASLFCSSKWPPRRVAILVFLIDRAFPYIEMRLMGWGASEIAAAIAYAVRTMPEDLFLLLFRLGGIYALIAVGYAARRSLHRGFGDTPAQKAS